MCSQDTDMLWQDHSDLGRQRPEEELVGDTWREIWRDGGRSYDLANRELAQDLSDQVGLRWDWYYLDFCINWSSNLI